MLLAQHLVRFLEQLSHGTSARFDDCIRFDPRGKCQDILGKAAVEGGLGEGQEESSTKGL